MDVSLSYSALDRRRPFDVCCFGPRIYSGFGAGDLAGRLLHILLFWCVCTGLYGRSLLYLTVRNIRPPTLPAQVV